MLTVSVYKDLKKVKGIFFLGIGAAVPPPPLKPPLTANDRPGPI